MIIVIYYNADNDNDDYDSCRTYACSPTRGPLPVSVRIVTIIIINKFIYVSDIAIVISVYGIMFINYYIINRNTFLRERAFALRISSTNFSPAPDVVLFKLAVHYSRS